MNVNSPRQVFLRTGLGSAAALSLVLLAGCGGGKSKTLSLSGKVSYKDQPVPGGTLTLTPSDGKTQPVKTSIGGDGSYLVTPPTVGDVKVTVETESIRGTTGPGYRNPPPGMKPPDVDQSKLSKYKPIPRKYANVNTSDLSVNIQNGPNTKNFDLTD